MLQRSGGVMSCLCLLLLAGCESAKPEHFVSTAGRFQVEMPGKPKETTQQVRTAAGPLPGHIALAESASHVIYSVTYADLPADFLKSQSIDDVLDSAADGVVASSRGSLRDKRPITLGPVPGREVRFAVNPAGSTEHGSALARILLAENRLYLLLVLGGMSKYNDQIALAFCDSFKLGIEDEPAPQSVPNEAVETPPVIGAKSGERTPWGQVVNGDDATIVRVEGLAAIMDLDGRNYSLGSAANEQNAPRIMRPIVGNFVATVRVVGDDRPSDSPAAGAKVSFQGAGLLLMGKAGELIRLERASVYRDGKLHRYILFEQHVAGAPVNGQNLDYDGGPVTLKLERKGNLVLGSFSTDGVKWQSFGSNNSTISGGEVGVAAMNTSSLPFLACFEGLNVQSK